MMTHETEQIFSSTGSLGVSRRQYNRLYVNGTEFAADPDEVETNFRRLTAIADRYPDRLSRSIYRGAVSQEVMQSLQSSDLYRQLEVALPLREFTGDQSWLVYLAQNQPGREQLVPSETMVRNTNEQHDRGLTTLQRLDEVRGRGYRFVDGFTPEQTGQILDLWGETFGWEEQEVRNLQRRLERSREQQPHDRDVWFSAIRDNGTIISAAMAERLSIPVDGRMLDLVESTEWRTRREYSGQHLVTANLIMLNGQILSDLHDSRNGTPLIFAECNYQSRSDRAGFGAGFRIPVREDGRPAPQIIVQNVLVRDGASAPEGALRDFTPMYLPMEQIQTGYNPNALATMTSYRETAY